MKKFYAVLNLIITIGVIIWNYFANTGSINNKTIGELSDSYSNLFTPADYAFAIWGVIFLGLMANAIYQVTIVFKESNIIKEKILTGPWLIIANLANGLWIWFWLNEQTGASVITMTILLLSLIITVLKLNLENWNASRRIILLGWWPITIYIGWISVALIANVASYLSKIGWAENKDEVSYTILMITIAGILNLFMLIFRNMREFCLVGIWSLIAIAVGSSNSNIEATAYICAIILFILTGIHGIKNIKQNPFIFPKNYDTHKKSI